MNEVDATWGERWKEASLQRAARSDHMAVVKLHLVAAEQRKAIARRLRARVPILRMRVTFDQREESQTTGSALAFCDLNNTTELVADFDADDPRRMPIDDQCADALAEALDQASMRQLEAAEALLRKQDEGGMDAKATEAGR